MNKFFNVIKSDKFLSITEKVFVIGGTLLGIVVSSRKEETAKKEIKDELRAELVDELTPKKKKK